MDENDDVTEKDKMILKLQEELESQRNKMKNMETQIADIRRKHLEAQNESESEFELRINKLLRQNVGLVREGTQEKRQVGEEKRASEEEHMQESKIIVQSLREQISTIHKEKSLLEQELAHASSDFISKLGKLVEKLHGSLSPRESEMDTTPVPKTSELLRNLRVGVDRLMDEKEEFVQEINNRKHENGYLEKVLDKLQNENFTLKEKIKRAQDQTLLLRLEKAHLEANFEVDSEKQFNLEKRLSISSSGSGVSLSEGTVGTNPPSPSSRSAREHKAFMAESLSLTNQSTHQLIELDPTQSSPKGLSPRRLSGLLTSRDIDALRMPLESMHSSAEKLSVPTPNNSAVDPDRLSAGDGGSSNTIDPRDSSPSVTRCTMHKNKIRPRPRSRSAEKRFAQSQQVGRSGRHKPLMDSPLSGPQTGINLKHKPLTDSPLSAPQTGTNL